MHYFDRKLVGNCYYRCCAVLQHMLLHCRMRIFSLGLVGGARTLCQGRQFCMSMCPQESSVSSNNAHCGMYFYRELTLLDAMMQPIQPSALFW